MDITSCCKAQDQVNHRPEGLRVNSFFAGIGGFELGFEAAGGTISFQCEIDSFCQTILSRHWPDVFRVGDINDVSPDQIPDADVWTGGFPCQDVSVARARERLGLKGSQSGLFFRFAELIEARKPKVVIIENVTGLLNSNEGRDFRVILEILCDMGYAVAWRTFNSRYFGVPQSRPRVYICAWLGDPSKAAHVLFEETDGKLPTHIREDFLEPTGDPSGPVVPRISYCLAATSGRHTGTDWSRTYVVYPSINRVRRITPQEAEGLQGFPTFWTLPEDERFGSPDDIDSLRYAALGNAVTVDVVKWIAKRVNEAFELDAPAPISQSSAVALEYLGLNIPDSELDEFANNVSIVDSVAPVFRQNSSRQIGYLGKEEAETEKFKWTNAGLAWKNAVVGVRMSPAPSSPVDSQLIDIIEKGQVDERYFISANAAEGILRRVRNQNRRLFEPLYQVLKVMAAEGEDKESMNVAAGGTLNG